jgi:hypothetical protein
MNPIQKGSIRALCFSPQADVLITGGQDGVIRLWDVRSGCVMKELPGHSGGVNAIRLTSDKKYFLSASGDGTLRFWNIETGECLRTLLGHTNHVTCCALMPAVPYAVSGGADREIRIWDVRSGECLRVLQGHTDWVSAVCPLADNDNILTAGYDGIIRVWNIQSGACIRAIDQGHGIKDAVVSADGKFVLSCGSTFLWDVKSGEQIASFAGHKTETTACGLTSDGSKAVTGARDGSLLMWSLKDQTVLAAFEGHHAPIRRVALSLDDQLIASSDRDGVVFVRRTETCKTLCEMGSSTPHRDMAMTEPELPAPEVVLFMLRNRIAESERKIMSRGCSGDYQTRDAMEQALRALGQARRDLESVDVNSPDAMQLYSEIPDRLDRLLTEARLCMADSEGADGLAGSGYGRSFVSHVSHPESAEHEGCKATVMPCPITDLVHFSITSPPVVTFKQTYLMDVWAHLERQRQEVIQRAKEEADGKEIRIKSRGPVKLARGNVLTVSPRIAGFTIDPPQDTIAWEGEIGNVQFIVSVPGEAVIGDHPGICDFHVNGLKIASLRFMVTVGATASERESLFVQERRAKRVFASYASEDRDAVLARIHGLLKGIPDLEVFLDVVSLRSGQRWRERLRDEVLSRDLLYLFWSQAASESEWVDWEWRCAYDQKGIEFIDPVPLVSPNVVPPPRELADLHFNDWVLAYMRTEGSPGHGGGSPPPETHDKGQT